MTIKELWKIRPKLTVCPPCQHRQGQAEDKDELSFGNSGSHLAERFSPPQLKDSLRKYASQGAMAGWFLQHNKRSLVSDGSSQ